jgi:hypothetical protein
MLRSAKEITGYSLEAVDGPIGLCGDVLFDDEEWTIRYMVADTGTWLPGRKVLISPISLGQPNWDSRLFPVQLTREQIRRSPGLDEDAALSSQYEMVWLSHYGYHPYWIGAGSGQGGQTVSQTGPPSGDVHLRSTNDVRGYRVKAKDGEIGHIEDHIIDDEAWIL